VKPGILAKITIALGRLHVSRIGCSVAMATGASGVMLWPCWCLSARKLVTSSRACPRIEELLEALPSQGIGVLCRKPGTVQISSGRR